MKHSIKLALVLALSAFGFSGPTSAGELIRAQGSFTVEIDFSTLALSQIGENCLITVDGVVSFTGTLEGIATTRTRALAFASCGDVAVLPPGAYEDIFTSAFEFAGKVDGRPIVADLTYRGRTALGGEVEAVFIPSNGLKGRLFVDAIVAAGGSYSGFLRIVGF